MEKITKENYKKLYWYKKDLQTFCRDKGLPSYGTKAELLVYIEKYFMGCSLDSIKPFRKRRSFKKIKCNEMNAETKILDSGFCLNNEAREFFKSYFGLDKFSFTKNMAVKLREIEKKQDSTATIQDLINVYLDSNRVLNSEEEKTYEWNNFVKDFLKDSNSQIFHSKMKVASILWKKAKQNSSRKYNTNLISKYKNEVNKYAKKTK